jgi:putative SOS response-associated peptidase YedK
MCGRYTLAIDKSTIEHHFGAKFYIAQPSYDWWPTYNNGPSQMLPIIRTYNSDASSSLVGASGQKSGSATPTHIL